MVDGGCDKRMAGPVAPIQFHVGARHRRNALSGEHGDSLLMTVSSFFVFAQILVVNDFVYTVASFANSFVQVFLLGVGRQYRLSTGTHGVLQKLTAECFERVFTPPRLAWRVRRASTTRRMRIDSI